MERDIPGVSLRSHPRLMASTPHRGRGLDSAAPHAWYNLPMRKHENRLSASVIAGAACTIIAVVGGLYLVTVHLGWVRDDLVEPIESVIVGVIGISIAAFSIWLVIRYFNRRDDRGR